MISINNLNIQYGSKHLFRDLSAMVNPQDKIGLVGVNGAGKSTLLKIMAGITETDFGTVTRAKKATVGYLPQEADTFSPGRSLYEEAETAFAHLLQLQEDLERLNQELAVADPSSPGYADLLEQQGELQHQLDHSGIFSMQANIEKVLIGLGFKETDFAADCSTFSGGWLMRLMLAKLLLLKPSFLFLDEPTNHLDIETVTWLEDFLINYDGALIIISHDRTFLDNTTCLTWELSLGKLNIYKGNYSHYVQEKEVRLEIQKAAYENQQAQIQQTMRFVQRFRAKSTKAKQVQSRLKQLEKMDLVELEETEKQIAFTFPPAAASGRNVIQVKSLGKNYNATRVFNDISFELQRGDKLAVIGVNGAGKSTLVRLLAGIIDKSEGIIQYGHNVTISYFGQHQAQELSPDLSVLETMTYVENDMSITQTRSLLGTFLFSGDDVDKKVAVLSGGEKSRLALAKMIASPANLLIMDEPTNHLDMSSQDILQKALAQFEGTIVIVSHNRYFLDTFINKVLVIKDGSAEMHHGNIGEYLDRRKQKEPEPKVGKQQKCTTEASPAPDTSRKKSRELRQIQAKIRQEKYARLAPVKQQTEKTEAEIEKLEVRKSELESLLADTELYKDEQAFADASKEYKDLERKLDRQYFKWEQSQAEVEAIEREFTRQLESNS